MKTSEFKFYKSSMDVEHILPANNEERIGIFTGSALAFFRPRKRTYFFLKWDYAVRKWYKHASNDANDYTNIYLHKTTTHIPSRCTININVRVRGGTDNILIRADTHYLESNGVNIPIVTPISIRSLPTTLIGNEYTLTADVSPNPYITNVRLWNSPPAPTPAPAPINKTIHIPTRIAWIIAEDACKNKETCPITMNDISPLTSAVTSCFHVFDKAALVEWFNRENKNTCPVCRDVCSMTQSYESDSIEPMEID